MSIVPLSQAKDPLLYGGKAAFLCKALQYGLNVPKGYAISKLMVQRYITGELQLFDELDEINRELESVAVRSSFVGEDGEVSSFAGQFSSYLSLSDVKDIEKSIRDIAKSASAKSVQVYREKAGLAQQKLEVCIVIQKMIPADISGILFTCNPVTGARERVIEATWGLGEALASGYITPDYYRMMIDGEIVEKQVGNKDFALKHDEHMGRVKVPLTDVDAKSYCLDEFQLKELNALATSCESVFGVNVDIEWSFCSNTLYLLQCRKVTG